jgi:hypothetical protein
MGRVLHARALANLAHGPHAASAAGASFAFWLVFGVVVGAALLFVATAYALHWHRSSRSRATRRRLGPAGWAARRLAAVMGRRPEHLWLMTEIENALSDGSLREEARARIRASRRGGGA